MIFSVKRQKIYSPSLNRVVYEKISDYDGNQYGVCRIGTQIWMTENLKTTHYADGTAIPNITVNNDWIVDTTGAYCWHSNNIANKNVYGALYNWFAVNHISGLAPEGWRIATDADWTTLTTFLGGIGLAGGILKEAGLAHWLTPNTGALDTYGFAKLGEGYRMETNGSFTTLTYYGFSWTATQSDVNNALARGFSYDNDNVTVGIYDKNVGFAVRCIKDT